MYAEAASARIGEAVRARTEVGTRRRILMNSPTNVLEVYKELAACYERRGQAQMRDRFLVLAADAAQAGGQADEAERLRMRLLQANPHHMLKPYATYDQARTAPDVDTYVRNLRLNYPLDVAADLLRALHASDDPGAQQLQQTAALPPGLLNEPTFRLNVDDERAAPAWNLNSDDDPEGTLAMPTRPAAQPQAKKVVDVEETAHLPVPGAQRPRVPTKADVERTESAPRAAAPRVGPAPRSAAPSRPSATTRPPASKAPPRPAPGPSPFASLPNEPKPAAAARLAPSVDESPEGNGWLASVLVVVVSLLGVAVAGYTLARPFLP